MHFSDHIPQQALANASTALGGKNEACFRFRLTHLF